MARNAKFGKVADEITNRTFGVEIEFIIPDNVIMHDDYNNESQTERDAPSFSERRLYSRKIIRTLLENRINVGWNCRPENGWELKLDGSVYNNRGFGFEITSPILTWEDVHQVDTVCNVLKKMGCFVTTKCGLHIHHGVEDLTPSEMAEIIPIYQSIEHILDEVIHDSRHRHRNRFCLGLEHIDVTKTRKFAKENHDTFVFVNWLAEHIRERYGYSNDNCRVYIDHPRYMKVNFISWVLWNTVEFRHHHGTLDAEEIRNWIILTQRIVETAKAGIRFGSKPRKINDAFWMLKLGVRSPVPEFANARAFYNAKLTKSVDDVVINTTNVSNGVNIARA